MEDEKGQTIAINSLTVRCGYTPPPKYSQGHSRNSKNEEASSDRAPNTANNKGFGKGFQKVFGNNMVFFDEKPFTTVRKGFWWVFSS